MLNSRIVRWYVLTIPASRKKDQSDLLEAEVRRRQREHEPTFEYFAPSYVEVKNIQGKLVKTRHPLLYNYVFIHASEEEIYRMKQRLPQYNFLPRIKGEDGRTSHYPYLTDNAMENLRWIARSYANTLPIYLPQNDQVMKGDKVRITDGKFKGVEATVIIQPGAGRKDIMVCIDNWRWVPLLHVQSHQYEVISLCTDNKHMYSNLDNERIITGLHQALKRYHKSDESLDEADKQLAEKVLRLYGNLQMETDVMRCKLYSLLLPAYTILGQTEQKEALIATIQSILQAVKAEQAKALLLVILYGCTDNSIYYDQAHRLIDPWRVEKKLKKSKLQLIQRLDDYDTWLNHKPGHNLG